MKTGRQQLHRRHSNALTVICSSHGQLQLDVAMVAIAQSTVDKWSWTAGLVIGTFAAGAIWHHRAEGLCRSVHGMHGRGVT